MPKVETWKVHCSCCCNREQDCTQDEEYETHIRCPGCGCRKVKPQPPSIKIRVYVMGVPNLQMLENMQEVARLMGADDKSILVREADERHYIELPGEGITTRLEIAEITGKRAPRQKSKPT